ncbi:PHD finger protein 1 isoform X1 [Erpetoichthys calabaricus]|uniref:PHD finger protein 1 isoform X1 n=1 Tax=Erpetoichthys calabaricus TaxID=27687 RepID=UPI0022341B2B|nr:PHD finger protein 1 isoform X1 [Erpetoichthys calabaricus]XP_028657697.2 PHD finger protein 1 isoform X1 [Erpetoichthys calabaricus]XP_028657706.2 PHD finger protein 1 isoform X1 [Erpetoichthys calabaricus]
MEGQATSGGQSLKVAQGHGGQQFAEGDDVLARWSDGLLYLGNIKRVDKAKESCLIRFEDNSEFWVLWKDTHSSVSPGMEGVCCVCKGQESIPRDRIISCHKCRHGYHQQCHVPRIEGDLDVTPWTCRQCVFAVATKRGGARKKGRFARLMQAMKLLLPYQLSDLDWDPQHLTNQQQCYCYCAGPGEWNLKMLQCWTCGQWFHEACTQCLTKPLLYGDRFYQFECSVCTRGPETIRRLPMNWVDVSHLVLYHLSLCCKKKYFDFEREILSFINENWDSLMLGSLSDTPKSERGENILTALNSHRDRFVSGKEIKKKKCLFGLHLRAPPPLTSDLTPVTPDLSSVMPQGGGSSQSRRSPLAERALGQRREKKPEPESRSLELRTRKAKRAFSRAVTQDLVPNPVSPNQLYQGYVGSSSTYNFRRPEERWAQGSPPKRMFASFHPSASTVSQFSSPPASAQYQYSEEDSTYQPSQVFMDLTDQKQDPSQAQNISSCSCTYAPNSSVGFTSQGANLTREAVRILARRVTVDGTVQYLVEWGNVNMF